MSDLVGGGVTIKTTVAGTEPTNPTTVNQTQPATTGSQNSEGGTCLSCMWNEPCFK